jgi:hypothetical protein
MPDTWFGGWPASDLFLKATELQNGNDGGFDIQA